jgi:hypothetical protein
MMAAKNSISQWCRRRKKNKMVVIRGKPKAAPPKGERERENLKRGLALLLNF